MVRQGVLVALPFDDARGVLTGNAVPIARAAGAALSGRAAFSASSAGLIAYRTNATIRQQLVWVDRAGVVSSSLGSAEDALNFPELAPDGKRVAVESTVQGNTDVWLVDARTGVTDRFTLDPNSDGAPVWAPDGSRVVFRSNRNGSFDLFQKPTGGEREEAALLTSSAAKFPSDWSPDGGVLLYVNQDDTTGSDLWALPLEDTPMPFPVVQTRFSEDEGQFSPDGRWIAYRSNESGRLEIYVRPFPGLGGARRISVDGGSQPRWRRDGKELFYVASDDKLMAVPIGERANLVALDVGTPIPLFSTRLAGAGFPKQQYAVARDGERFLMNVIAEQGTSYITIVQNWGAILQEWRRSA
jgi:Tol biopolymer transport system component